MNFICIIIKIYQRKNMVNIMKLNKSPELVIIAFGLIFAVLLILFGFFYQPSAPTVNVVYGNTQPTTIADTVPIADINQNSNYQSQLININTADKETLCSLKGIGEAKAEKIIAYRNSHGGFATVEEIMQVNGIGEKTFEAIKDDITV